MKRKGQEWKKRQGGKKKHVPRSLSRLGEWFSASLGLTSVGRLYDSGKTFAGEPGNVCWAEGTRRSEEHDEKAGKEEMEEDKEARMS